MHTQSPEGFPSKLNRGGRMQCRVCECELDPSEFPPSEVTRHKASGGSRRGRCRSCDNARIRARYRDGYRAPSQQSGGWRRYYRYTPSPTGKVVNCSVCGAEFRRTSGKIRNCSKECSAEAVRRRYRRKAIARKWKIRGGDDYTTLEIAERDGFKCHLCRRRVSMSISGTEPMGPTVDHLIPLSMGGQDSRENVALAHRVCNIKRSNRGHAQLLLVG